MASNPRTSSLIMTVTTVTIPVGVATKVLDYNPSRRYLKIHNATFTAGQFVYIGFDASVTNLVGFSAVIGGAAIATIGMTGNWWEPITTPTNEIWIFRTTGTGDVTITVG